MYQISADSSKFEHAVRLNRILERIKTIKIGIVFPMLDIESLCIRGYADAGYRSNEDLSSQVSMLVVLMDKNKNASIIHYGSWKSRRVVRSPLAAEVYALTDCFDFCFTLSYDISKMLGKKIPIYLHTDSKSIFDMVMKLSNVSEKRLMIDISSLRQSYNSGEIENIAMSLLNTIWQTYSQRE